MNICIVDDDKYVVEKSNLVFFGFDNVDSAILHNNGRIMPEKILFPLKNYKSNNSHRHPNKLRPRKIHLLHAKYTKQFYKVCH